MMVTKHDILSAAEERALFERYQQGDRRAGDRLIMCNQRFVLQQAMRWVRFGVPLEDLAQEANIGMLVALKRFEPARGLRFITYATWWVRAYLRLMVMRRKSLVRRPSYDPAPYADASLDATLADGETTHLDLLLDTAPSPEAAAAEREQIGRRERDVEHLLRGLSERERAVVLRRYLADDGETLREIGESYDVSRERIRQIELRAFKKLRKRLAA